MIVKPLSEYDGVISVSFRYNKDLVAAVKAMCGRWDPKRRAWLVSRFFTKDLHALAIEHGDKWNWMGDTPPYREGPEDWDGAEVLYPHQRNAVRRALNLRSYILNFAPGLGKTLTAIQLMRLRAAENVVVVCPAKVRREWQLQLDKWWNEHPEVFIHTSSKDELPRSGIIITSYNLLKYAARHAQLCPVFEGFVFDELHNLGNERSKQSKYAEDLVMTNSKAWRLGLTGTIVRNRPAQLYHQLHTIQPKAWGTYFTFTERYCEIEQGEHGRIVHGLREDRKDELSDRLYALTSRATFAEVAHHLPPFHTSVEVVPSGTTNLAALDVDDLDLDVLDGWMETATPERSKGVIPIIKGDWNEERVCIVVHKRETAEHIRKAVRKACRSRRVEMVTGALTHDKRLEVIKHAMASVKGVLVCTMHSVGEGINDLVGFNRVIWAEYVWDPGTMIQMMRRFHRLSSEDAVHIRFLQLEDTIDERIVSSLREKIDDINKVVEPGETEAKLAEVTAPQSDDVILEALKKVTL